MAAHTHQGRILTSNVIGATPSPHLPEKSPPRLGFAAILYIGVVVAAIPALATLSVAQSRIFPYLPTAAIDLGYSFGRMTAAYALSLGFSLVYGYVAASNRSGERVLIPVLDILQSVPILGFFPVAIVFFVALTPGSQLGANLASVFLIFTSMAWNMVFGVYESLKTLPTDLKETADSFNVRGLQRLRQVLFPATVNRLVYNSVLSWTAGWFFLVAAEIFTTNGTNVLPGIGSFLYYAAAAGNGDAFFAGLILLIALIATLDFFVWRPLGRYAERFRYDTAPSGEGDIIPGPDPLTILRRAARFVTRGVRTGVTVVVAPFASLRFIAAPTKRVRGPWESGFLRIVLLGVILVFAWLLVITIAVAVLHVFTSPIPLYVRRQILLLPFAVGASAGRLLLAYGLSLGIALPLAIYLARRPRASRVGLPIVEVVASFPATALFPVIIFELIPYTTPEGASVLMLMTGMIWYLFFNLLAGIRQLPPDLDEAARSFGSPRQQYLRRVLLPAVFPAYVTGSITAFGGGWNTLIVAEYLTVGTGQSFHVLGVGELLDIGYAESQNLTVVGGLALMTAALFVLVSTVVAVNELIWKPLYRRAVEKYRYD